MQQYVEYESESVQFQTHIVFTVVFFPKCWLSYTKNLRGKKKVEWKLKQSAKSLCVCVCVGVGGLD